MNRTSVTLILALPLLGASCTKPEADASYPACSAAAEACLDRIAIPAANGAARNVPFFRNFAIDAPNAAVTRAIIVVHGSDRDAGNYFQTLLTAAQQSGLDGQTIILSPHFQCGADHVAPGDVRWSCDDPGAWSHGGQESSRAEPPLYSFSVIDAFVQALATKTTFPNLGTIVVTGMSAGGQFTQRYAETTAVDPTPGVALKYVVLSPSSYAYLDGNRPHGGCAAYDEYPYGLEDRAGYVAIPPVAQLQTQYVARSVAYLVGDTDTLANAAGTGMDTSCEANAQGVDRLARARAFWEDMRTQYQAMHTLAVVPGCEHSRTCMYYSLEGRAAIFP